MVSRVVILAALALAIIAPTASARSAQDEKLGSLGRTYIRQAMAIPDCTTVDDCTTRMVRTIKTAGALATRAQKLLNAGDTSCAGPAGRLSHVWLKTMEPAIKRWMKRPGTFEAKQGFMNATMKVAATLPDVYHKC